MPTNSSKYPVPLGDSKISDIIKELQLQIKRLRLRPSASIRVTETPAGTIVETKKGGGGGSGGEAVWL